MYYLSQNLFRFFYSTYLSHFSNLLSFFTVGVNDLSFTQRTQYYFDWAQAKIPKFLKVGRLLLQQQPYTCHVYLPLQDDSVTNRYVYRTIITHSGHSMRELGMIHSLCIDSTNRSTNMSLSQAQTSVQKESVPFKD